MLAFSVACATGCLVRYGTEKATHRLLGLRRMWGTLLVNVLGCLAVGVIVGRTGQPAAWIVPFCGGLTSYSAAFAGPIESWLSGSRRSAVVTLVGTPLLCVAACALGMTL